MQITKNTEKGHYIASQQIALASLPVNAQGVSMPGLFIAEGYTVMQAVMGVTVMICFMCERYKIHPDQLELL